MRVAVEPWVASAYRTRRPWLPRSARGFLRASPDLPGGSESYARADRRRSASIRPFVGHTQSAQPGQRWRSEAPRLRLCPRRQTEGVGASGACATRRSRPACIETRALVRDLPGAAPSWIRNVERRFATRKSINLSLFPPGRQTTYGGTIVSLILE